MLSLRIHILFGMIHKIAYLCSRVKDKEGTELFPFFIAMKQGLEIVRQFLDELFREEDFADCFFIEMELQQPSMLKIYLDADQGLTLNRCTRINRRINQLIEEKELPNWGVEISSPGLSRPLANQRQYRKNMGRLLEVNTAEHGKAKGHLIEVKSEYIKINRSTNNKNESKEMIIPWDEVVAAKVIPQFKKTKK